MGIAGSIRSLPRYSHIQFLQEIMGLIIYDPAIPIRLKVLNIMQLISKFIN
jgi:hypothetical protein